MAKKGARVICPKCQSEMAEIVERGVTIDRCVSCDFLWFDPNEIDRYLRGSHSSPAFETPGDSSFKIASNADGGLCTRCNLSALQSGAVSGVPFLRCRECEGIGISIQDIRAIRHCTTRERPPRSEPHQLTESTLLFSLEIVGAIIEGLTGAS